VDRPAAAEALAVAGGFVLGGRGARGQQPYQGSVTYTFGGSVFDAAPYQLRPDVPVTEPQFAQNTFGATFGGRLKIPHLYADTNRRTTFQLNYTGNESNNLFDQYATVPTDAMRQGDFSASPSSLIDPISGQPFAGNQIPASRIDPSAASLLQYIPTPNLPGTNENFHVSTTAHTSSEAISLRVTQNLSPTVAQGGGRGGFGGRGTNIFLSGQLQYRETDTQALNVFPNLGGDTTTRGVTAPLTLTVARNRSVQLFTFNATHSSIDTTNAFTNTQNAAGLAGIQYPGTASTDPLNWGVPNLSFSGFTGAHRPILTFAFEEIKPTATAIEHASTLTGLTGLTALTAAAGTTTPAKTAAPVPDDTPSHPLTSEQVAGHRLLTLVFDTSSMQPDEVQKAVDGAMKWVDQQMTPADLVAVAAINANLQLLTDFTSSKERMRAVLSSFAATDGTAFSAADPSTAATDEAAQTAADDADAIDQSAQELDTFNNDVRLRALKTLADALAPIQQKKAILYFSSGMQRSGTDNQVELRAAVNAAAKANVAIYPVDARGLQVIVPGGSARTGSRGGAGAFSGSAVAGQFTELAAQQETLTALASDTGGTAFTDSNDFGEAFARVERDISSYYILGFVSANTNKDGRYRRLSVRVKNRPNVRVEAKGGLLRGPRFRAHRQSGS
jgi:VWFA-related protein